MCGLAGTDFGARRWPIRSVLTDCESLHFQDGVPATVAQFEPNRSFSRAVLVDHIDRLHSIEPTLQVVSPRQDIPVIPTAMLDDVLRVMLRKPVHHPHSALLPPTPHYIRPEINAHL